MRALQYLLFSFMLSLHGMNIDQQQKKNLQKDIKALVDVIKGCEKRLSTTHMPKKNKEHLERGLVLLEEFGKTISIKPAWNHLSDCADQFDKAHTAKIRIYDWSHEENKHTSKQKTLTYPLAAYAGAVAYKLSRNFKKAFDLSRQAYNAYPLYPLSIGIANELKHLAELNYKPAKKFLEQHPEIDKTLENEIQKLQNQKD